MPMKFYISDIYDVCKQPVIHEKSFLYIKRENTTNEVLKNNDIHFPLDGQSEKKTILPHFSMYTRVWIQSICKHNKWKKTLK